MVRVVAASFVSALVAYLLVRITITNQTDLSALRLGLAIGIFAATFSLISWVGKSASHIGSLGSPGVSATQISN